MVWNGSNANYLDYDDESMLIKILKNLQCCTGDEDYCRAPRHVPSLTRLAFLGLTDRGQTLYLICLYNRLRNPPLDFSKTTCSILTLHLPLPEICRLERRRGSEIDCSQSPEYA